MDVSICKDDHIADMCVFCQCLKNGRLLPVRSLQILQHALHASLLLSLGSSLII